MRRAVFAALAIAAAATLATGAASAGGGSGHTWRVTIENLTPPGSQPLSPPLFVVHSEKAHVWRVGEIATHPVAAIAEDANNAPAESAFAALPGVDSVSTGAGGPIGSGESRSYTVETSGAFDRLSVLTMLVNTNDAFTGLDSLHLHGQGQTLETMAYDAGSERNNELQAFIPGPCCNHPFVRDPEGALIRPHAGITGAGDLSPAVYGWTGAVARIGIERTS